MSTAATCVNNALVSIFPDSLHSIRVPFIAVANVWTEKHIVGKLATVSLEVLHNKGKRSNLKAHLSWVAN